MEADTFREILRGRMSEENVEIVRSAIAAFNAGGLERAQEFVHPEIEFQEPPTQPAPRTVRGREQTRLTFAAFDEAWEEHRTEVEEIRELGENEVLTFTIEHFRGRDGIEISQPAGSIYTLRDRKIVKLRPFWDRRQALEAAGLSK